MAYRLPPIEELLKHFDQLPGRPRTFNYGAIDPRQGTPYSSAPSPPDRRATPTPVWATPPTPPDRRSYPTPAPPPKRKPSTTSQQQTSESGSPYMTAQELSELARQQAAAENQGLIDYYREQQERARQQALMDAQWQQQLASALAGLMGNVSPQIQGLYSGATKDIYAGAQGFSDGMRSTAEASATDLNAQMQQLANAPDAQLIDGGKATAAGDALYGLGGWIPGQQMAREGAGFASAAAFLPATTLMQGQRNAADAYAQGAKSDAEIEAEIRKIVLAQPGRAQEILADLQRHQFDLQKWDAEQQWKQRDYDLKVAAEIRKSQPTPSKPYIIQNASGIYRVNPNGTLTQLKQLDPKASRPIVVGSDKQGRKVLDGDTGKVLYELPPVVTPGKKGKAGSTAPKYTAGQLKDFGEIASETARDAFYGVPSEGDFPAVAPKTYQEALADLTSSGVPLTIAQRALNRHWRKGARVKWVGPEGGGSGVARVVDGFILMPWEKPGEGRPLVPIQQRKQGKAEAAAVTAPGSLNYKGTPLIATHGTQTPQRVILHTTEGESSPESITGYWKSQGKGFGAQFIIGNDGKVLQTADPTALAYHAGGMNSGSIGIEIVGWAKYSRAQWMKRKPQLEAIAQTLARISAAYGIPLQYSANGIWTHNDVSKTTGASEGHWDPGPGFPMEWVLRRAKQLSNSKAA